ncbi:MAG: hypothetical protein CEE41_03190, partial [Hadesarchaea archaeon B3_Hades]
RVAKTTGISDEEIRTNLTDYGVPRRERPILREVTYAELKSGRVEVGGKEIPVSPLSSLKQAREIAGTLKKWIDDKKFFLTQTVEGLSTDQVFQPMRQITAAPVAKDLMTREVVTAKPSDSITSAAKIFSKQNFDHLPIVDEKGKLVGIVTSWDIAVAVGTGKRRLSEILTSKVIVASENEPIDAIARKLETHGISGVPVVSTGGELRGILTSEDISKLIGRRRR